MDIKLLKKIIKEFEGSIIHKLEITEKDFTVKMEKKNDDLNLVKQTENISQSERVQPPKETIEEDRYTPVKSPLVGTFYDAPSPDSSPFVKVNQKVSEGDVLCIIEAMKVMNEIRSPKSGTIKRIDVSNESMVEFGQVLIEIEEA